MITLLSAGVDSLSLITTQNGASVVTAFSTDISGVYNGTRQLAAITSATTTTIVTAPGSGSIDVEHINIRNTYAGSHTITVQFNNNGTLHTLVVITLAQNETLEYTHAGGWHTIDANGAAKVGTAGWVIAAGVTGTLNASITFDGTGGTTMTFPSTSATIARTDAAQTFAGSQTFSGNIGVGTANAFPANYAVEINTTALTATSQYGVVSDLTGSSNATLNIVGFASLPATAAAAFTATLVAGYRAFDAVKGAGSSITSLYGVRIDDQTQGSNNYGLHTSVSAGALKWNIYSLGTAQSSHLGSFRFGSNVAPTATVDVTGTALISSTLGVAGVLSVTDATDATSATAASLKTAGGIAAAKGIWVAENFRFASGTAGVNAIGGAPSPGKYLTFNPTFSTTGNVAAYSEQSAITMTGGATIASKVAYGLAGGITLNTGGAVANVATLYMFEPNITVSSGSATVASTLYIADAPTEGTTNWALKVASGAVDFVGNVRIGAATAPTVALDVTGAALISTTLGVTGVSAFGGATSSASTAAIFPAGTTAISSIRLPHGAAPTSPVDGDVWTTTAGLYVRVNGSTVGPLS